MKRRPLWPDGIGVRWNEATRRLSVTFEIALGILLTILVVAFLLEIIALGFIALAVGSLLAVGSAVLYWGFVSPQSFFIVLLLTFIMLAKGVDDVGALRPGLDRFGQKLPPRMRRWFPLFRQKP
jgi:hypothetical protein